MNNQSNDSPRRGFLKSLGAGGVLSLSELGFLNRLPAVSAGEAELPRDAVRFSDDIEPLVRLLEETSREKVIEAFAAKIQTGTSYREILAALLLAGVRNVQPRPSVGFKFHAVLVVNSAHLASLAAPDRDRWLPIFWALDYFKSSQSRDQQEGDWTMAAVDESKLPPSHRAKRAFRDAMDTWDIEAADVAVTAMCRSSSAAEVFDLLAHYGCRDFRSIGHKAIYVANSYRTLQCIGWRFAEPVLRSLAYALLNHQGDPLPSTHDLEADAAWRVTQGKLSQQHENGNRRWDYGRIDRAASLTLLDTLRVATPTEAVNATLEMVNDGIAAQSISDALFLSSAEMLAQQPGIISLHSVTTTNAMQFAYRTTFKHATRHALMLQNAAFIPHFRESMTSRGNVGADRIDVAQAAHDSDDTNQPPTLDAIFTSVSENREQACRQMQAYLNGGGQASSLIDAARRLVFLKGNDAHDYKFSSAAFEDYHAVSPEFRNICLGAAAYLLPGSNDRDNGLVDQVRAAFLS